MALTARHGLLLSLLWSSWCRRSCRSGCCGVCASACKAGRRSVQEVCNAYLNRLRYTDHVVAQALQMRKAQESRVDTALVYVSDHGESLREHGLFLHGMPYALTQACRPGAGR